MSLHDNAAQRPDTSARQLPVGGFVIDAEGREVPITEDMIQRACSELEENRQTSDEPD
tara:strand:- start:2658 stop:2831 length:174 start_codon:yes stop_codon:yes gene_type:complete